MNYSDRNFFITILTLLRNDDNILTNRGEKMNYKISELANKTGVTKRTIHYYISKGLLLPPEGEGVNSVYNDEHLKRILLIKKLQSEYMPLNKIRE